jgi:hypothetical protein
MGPPMLPCTAAGRPPLRELRAAAAAGPPGARLAIARTASRLEVGWLGGAPGIVGGSVCGGEGPGAAAVRDCAEGAAWEATKEVMAEIEG